MSEIKNSSGSKEAEIRALLHLLTREQKLTLLDFVQTLSEENEKEENTDVR